MYRKLEKKVPSQGFAIKLEITNEEVGTVSKPTAHFYGVNFDNKNLNGELLEFGPIFDKNFDIVMLKFIDD